MSTYRPKPISGFPEHLPEIRHIELNWLDRIRQAFESYGFTSLETPAVEEIDVLLAKGETDKEIYTLTRLQADAKDHSDARLAMHFDLTVPFARYVAQHFNDLTFPFKRYQIQKVWRGERPQKGRMREFYQCDIDVVNVDTLPLHFDAELPAIMYQILNDLDIGDIKLQISNRKILVGYLAALGIDDITPVTRTLDKLDKLEHEAVMSELETLGLDTQTAQKALALAHIKTTDSTFADQVRALGIKNDMLSQGLEELAFVIDNLAHLPSGAVEVDLSIVRGLDYYTGTVYETRFVDDPEYGSICSGGRYEDLAGSFINRKLPGVGISIGFSRLFARMLDQGKLIPTRKCPTDVLVILPNEDRRASVLETANTLRARGLSVEMYHAPQKIKKQLSYAEKKGIPFVWFPPFEDGQSHEVKNMTTGQQTAADPQNWTA